eukprot:UN33509
MADKFPTVLLFGLLLLRFGGVSIVFCFLVSNILAIFPTVPFLLLVRFLVFNSLVGSFFACLCSAVGTLRLLLICGSDLLS